jgi:cellulose synthase/poly-beta-1,6-N-acetylglucosamine synthase-like glycosyltransferase
MKQIFFSVIIPLREINNYLVAENLPALDGQSFTNFEVIVLPNYISEKDFKLFKKYKWLKIIPTGNVTRPAQKRDIGVKKAKGNIIAFIDDDAFPSSNWLKEAERIFKKEKVEAICGPGILPKKVTIWEKVFDEILKTYIGSGGFAYRFVRDKVTPRFVDDYPSMNFLIKKNVFNKLGGFNNEYWPGEDSKLCEDLVYKYNGKIYYNPNLFIYHHRRTDLPSYLKQHGQYGYHRGAFFAHGDKNSRRITYLVPSLFILYLVLLLFFYFVLHFTSYMWQVPLIIYGLLLSFVGIKAFNNTKSLKIGLLSYIVLFLMHATYGVKFVQGFFVGITKKEKIY